MRYVLLAALAMSCASDDPGRARPEPEPEPEPEPLEVPDHWTLAPMDRRWYGEEDEDYAGRYVDLAQLDELPGDELLVGAPSTFIYGTQANEPHSSGYLLFGDTPGGLLEEVAPIRMPGAFNDSHTGSEIVGLGDVTGDGSPDVGMVSLNAGQHPGAGSVEGVQMVVFSGPFDAAASPLEFDDVSAWHTVDLLEDASYFTSWDACGDVNGDGVDELCFGATGSSFSEAPITEAPVWFGPVTGAFTYDDLDLRVQGAEGAWGQTRVVGSDLDGDGVSELLIGEYQRADDAGGVYLVSDPGAGIVPLGEYPLWEGEPLGGQAGLGLSIGCDVDENGRRDFFVGAPIYDGRKGRAYVVTNDDGGALLDVAHTIVTTEEPFDWLGYDGALADLDGDGTCDLVVSAPRDIYFGEGFPGRLEVFYGPLPTGILGEDDADLILFANHEVDAFGLDLDAGDVDADGRADLLVGAAYDDTKFWSGGSASLILGSAL